MTTHVLRLLNSASSAMNKLPNSKVGTKYKNQIMFPNYENFNLLPY